MSRFLLISALTLTWGVASPGVRADAPARTARLEQRLGGRVTGAVSVFNGGDQTDEDKMEYDQPGLIGDVQLSMLLLPWLSAELGATSGLFFTSNEDRGRGGLLGPIAGFSLHSQSRRFTPFAAVDVGAGFTGTVVRPLLRGRLGIDVAVGRGFGVGPVLGYGHLIQKNGIRYSTDARFLFAGLSVSFRALPIEPPRVETKVVERVRERVVVEREPAPEPVNQVELFDLIESALPSPKEEVELLAPVLFAFDSDELEPIGVAMLHEVARLLADRPDIALVAVRGYADRRGGEAYNQALSERRARRVIAWLVEHGVAAERLQLDPQGASEFVESGESEGEHQQNRRVVFRVLRTEEP